MADSWKVHLLSLHDLHKPQYKVGDLLKHAKHTLWRDEFDPDLRNMVIQITSGPSTLTTRPFHVPRGHAALVEVDEVLFVPAPRKELVARLLRHHKHHSDALVGEAVIPPVPATRLKLDLKRGHRVEGSLTLSLKPALQRPDDSRAAGDPGTHGTVGRCLECAALSSRAVLRICGRGGGGGRAS
mmetsp:Transcript_52434/g.150311  ORF Transcript_52434/g.150311 Transcript_52434/m.150311 type:complete len:184 (+) Transcript_52434:65-616(+)